MPRYCFIFLVLAMLAPSKRAFAQSEPAVFKVPCQSQAEFLSRLRSLVQQPERAEQSLSEFAVIIIEDNPNAWTLIVSRRGPSNDKPRTVHDTSCEALAEVAPLVLSAWIDAETAPAAIAPPVAAPPPPPPTAAPEPAPSAPLNQGPPRIRLGFALRVEGATGLVPKIVSPGASVEFFTLYRNIGLRISSGFSYWLLRDDALLSQRSERFQRPIWEIYAQLGFTPLKLGDVSAGALLGLAIGPGQYQRSADSGLLSLRFIGALSAAWAMSEDWGLRLQLGVHFATTQFAVGPALALGVEYAFH